MLDAGGASSVARQEACLSVARGRMICSVHTSCFEQSVRGRILLGTKDSSRAQQVVVARRGWMHERLRLTEWIVFHSATSLIAIPTANAYLTLQETVFIAS